MHNGRSMRTWRGSVRFVSLALAALVSAGPASAQLLIATPKGETDAVASAELAYAVGGGVPVTWVALRLRNDAVIFEEPVVILDKRGI